MKKGEKILVALSVFALILNLFLIPFGGVLTVMTLSALSILYFYFGIALFNDIRLRKIVKKESYEGISPLRRAGAVGAGMALSVTTTGLMFKFQAWPGANIYLVIGLVGLVAVMVAGAVKYSKNKSVFYTRIVKRAVLYGGLGFMLILMPKYFLLEFKYRNYPDFVQAVKNAAADPGNPALQEKIKEERQKMLIKKTTE
jgi:hypothetical protein